MNLFDHPDHEPKRLRPRKLTEREKAALRSQHDDWLRYIVVSAFDGMAIGTAIALALIWFDINGIGSLLANSQHKTGYTLLLVGGLAHTFGMVVAGTAIWLRAVRESEE